MAKRQVLPMCLILFAYKVHPQYKLLVAANRDEFYGRPTAPVHYWEDAPDILAGRDLEKMGTWMGITKDGRFAALTNYRNPAEMTEGKRSRGEITAGVLKHKGSILQYLETLSQKDSIYSGYNLIAGDSNHLYYYSNIGKNMQELKPGIYGLSNHLLNTEWPKVKKGRDGLSRIIRDLRGDLPEELFALLQSSERAPDHLLPKTGVSLEMERMLSPLFIKSANYGTRSSTVLLMSKQSVYLQERVFSKDGFSAREFKI